METLYHGSIVEDIEYLNPISPSHDSSECRVVYLTLNKLYSLFYIWDEEKTGSKIKHVTCWCKDGLVYYEEQFDNQLKHLYEGVSGYVYSFDKNDSFYNMKADHIWVSENKVNVTAKEEIKNVYAMILEYEKRGLLQVYRYNDLSKRKKDDMINKIKAYIVMENLQNEDSDRAKFIKRYNPEAWKRAVEID